MLILTDSPNSTHTTTRRRQVAFDTVPGQWATVDLPFDRFVPVVRNRVDYKAPPLAATGGGSRRIATSFGLVYR